MYSRLAKIKNRIGKPLSQLPIYTRWWVAFYRFFVHVTRIWIRRDMFRISSGLAFESLFSLVPLAALGLWFIDAIGQSSQVKALADYVGRQLFPSFGPDAISMIRKMAYRIKGEYLGTVGAVFTLLISIMVFLSVEKAFNEVWESRKKRGFFSQFSTYWTLASLIPLITLLVFLRRTDYPIISSSWLAHIFVFFIFFLSNKLIPTTVVKVIPAIIGSFISFIFFEAARIAFSTYFSSKYYGIYGEIGVLFLMLVWIYYIWLTVMLGVIISYVFQRFSYLEDRRITESRWAVFPGEPLAWRAWSILDYMNHNREMHDTQSIALALGESSGIVELICSKLEDGDVIFKVGGRWGLAFENTKHITMAMVAKIFSNPVTIEAGKTTSIWQEFSDHFMELAAKVNISENDEFKRFIRETKKISLENESNIKETSKKESNKKEKESNKKNPDINEIEFSDESVKIENRVKSTESHKKKKKLKLKPENILKPSDK